MIKYNTKNINDWYFGTSDMIKVYRNGAIVFYKVSSGSTPTYDVCYAVVDDISQYQETEFEDVFNKADSKWYKLNNLNQYEEYGVYGSGRNITYYEGKLTIDDGYEYIYSGSSWVNVGEVSGGTATLPSVPFSVNYNAKDYNSSTNKIPQTSGQLHTIDATRNYGSGVVDHSADGYISITSNTRFVFSGNSGTYLSRSNTQANCPMTIISKAKTTNGYSLFTYRTSAARQYMYRQDKTYAYLCGTGNTSYFTCSSTDPNILSVRVYYDSGIKAKWNNWTTNQSSTPEEYAYNTQSLTNGGALFCDYTNSNKEFWRGDFYWVYMSQNALTDEQVQQVIAYNEGSGSTEYPIYYDEKSDPLDNLSFSSLTEANEYAYENCVYDGMKATIDGDKYYFDSDEGWVYNPSRLPSGYTEVEYVEKTADTSNYQASAWTVPNDGVSGNVYTYEMSMDSGQSNQNRYIGLFGGTFGYIQRQPSNVGYCINVGYYSWNDSTPYNFTMVYDTKLVYKLEPRKLTITNSSTSASTVINLNSSRTYSSDSNNVGVFCYNMNDGGAYMSRGKVYHILIQGSDSTVKHEYIPCKRDSDSKVGLYDIVGDNFYYPTAYTVTAGPEV